MLMAYHQAGTNAALPDLFKIISDRKTHGIGRIVCCLAASSNAAGGTGNASSEQY